MLIYYTVFDPDSGKVLSHHSRQANKVPAAGHAGIVVEGHFKPANEWRLGEDGVPHQVEPPPDDPITPYQVRVEAGRRIEAAWPQWRQLNTLREGTAAEIAAMGAAIDAIRAASNALEVMDPIPQDYRSDDWWG